MIKRDEVTAIGRTLKPHGLKGELSASLDFDIDINALKCIVLDIEGILIPFFISASRPKNGDTALLTIDGIDSDSAAAELSGKELFILTSDAETLGLSADDDILYLEELTGFTVTDPAFGLIGKIEHVDDTTENVVLVLSSPDGREILLPFAEEFVVSINEHDKILELDLPEGLLELNN